MNRTKKITIIVFRGVFFLLSCFFIAQYFVPIEKQYWTIQDEASGDFETIESTDDEQPENKKENCLYYDFETWKFELKISLFNDWYNGEKVSFIQTSRLPKWLLYRSIII